MNDETLARVEKQRLELEESVAQLRKSLRYWQTLEIDYEGLKEEFQGIPEGASREECLQAAKDFKPELVDDKELHSLFEDKQLGYKRPSQLVELLSKRVDYVARNISTIRKQLSDAEKKRNALLLAQDPEHQDDAALPLSEITEELDKEGKVISSKIETPGKDAPDLLEVLRKAGVPDVDGPAKSTDQTTTQPGPKPMSNVGSGAQSMNALAKSTPALTDSSRIEDLSDDEDMNLQDATINPTHPWDTEEEATLRQEMLQYGLGEVGAIVAELDLAESGDFSHDEDDEDYLSDYDENEDLYTDESEDERGATKNPVISERYKRQMEALSKKHGIMDLQNLGPEPTIPDNIEDQLNRPSAAEAARKAAIARHEANKSAPNIENNEDISSGEPKQKKKRVAFAPELDIAPEQASGSAAPQQKTVVEPAINPVGETIIERAADTTQQPTTAPEPPLAPIPPTTRKTSQFRASRSGAKPTTTSLPILPPPPSPSTSKPTPAGPPNHTISTTLVERPSSETNAPPDPSDFDESLHAREVAIEYQKLRNRRIHEQGGYVGGGKEDNYGEEIAPGEVMDEITGKPRKVSRFKAARMKG